MLAVLSHYASFLYAWSFDLFVFICFYFCFFFCAFYSHIMVHIKNARAVYSNKKALISYTQFTIYWLLLFAYGFCQKAHLPLLECVHHLLLLSWMNMRKILLRYRKKIFHHHQQQHQHHVVVDLFSSTSYYYYHLLLLVIWLEKMMLTWTPVKNICST